MRMLSWLSFFIKQLFTAKSALVYISLLTVGSALLHALAPSLIGRILGKAADRTTDGILPLILLALFAWAGAELLAVLRGYLSFRAMQNVTYRLTDQLLTSIFHTKIEQLLHTRRGELMQRCLDDTRAIQQFGLFTLPSLAQSLLLAGIAATVVGRMNAGIVIVLGVSYLILFVPIQRIGAKRKEARLQLVLHNADLRHSLLEKLEGLKQIRIFGTRVQEDRVFRREQMKWADLAYQNVWVHGLYQLFPRIPDSFAPAVVLLLAGWSVMHGQMTIAELATILAYIPAFNAPARSLFDLLATFGDLRARIQGMEELLQLPPEPGRLGGRKQWSSYCGFPIVCDNVSVCLEDGTPLLHNLSLTLMPGEHVAVVGPSGAGKSTLLKLFARLYEPASGHIRLGSAVFEDFDPVHWRGRIGYVPQESFLFHDSLMYNLTYLQKTKAHEVEAWLNAFGAEDLLNLHPQDVGDNGACLSGGQRQLVALIRMMLRQPDLLLLDEATSALDPASAEKVYAALNNHASSRLRISVVHRLEHCLTADRILVMESGRIVQQGTHHELIRSAGGLYQRLWQSEVETDRLEAETMRGA